MIFLFNSSYGQIFSIITIIIIIAIFSQFILNPELLAYLLTSLNNTTDFFRSILLWLLVAVSQPNTSDLLVRFVFVIFIVFNERMKFEERQLLLS